jgi:AraC family transcriptional regulator
MTTTARSDEEANAAGVIRVAAEIRLSEAGPNDSSIVAQLVEAACKARDGDHEATRLHIAHAVTLLQGPHSPGSGARPVPSKEEGRYSPAAPPAWRLRRAIAYIDANLSTTIRIPKLAALAGLSVSHFSRAFKRTFGESPRAYVRRRRIEFAQGLMLTTSEPLCSIAVGCGMCDQPHFTRTFHRVVGEPPGSWRRTRRAAMTDQLDYGEIP